MLAPGLLALAGFLAVALFVRPAWSPTLVLGLALMLVGVAAFVVGTYRHFGRLERRRRETEGMYESLVEHSQDGIIIFREDLILFANPAAAGLVGAPREQVQGQPVSAFVAAEDLPKVRENSLKRLRREPVPSEYEITLLRRDGARVPVEVAPAVVPYRGAPATQTVIRDLRARQELETRLLHSTRIAAIGELASGVAHQLNNPLIGILNMAQVLAEKIPAEDPRRPLADHIVRAGQDAAATVRNLLKFSRAPSADLEPVDLERLVQEVLSISGEKLAHDDIRVRLEKADGLDPVVQANANALGQVLLNLVQNAQHAIVRHGELVFRLGGAVCNGQPAVALSVRDTGCGITPENLPHVFEPFFTTKPREQGTGLGLSLAAQIVHAHRGRLEVESTPGQGAEFTMTLPRRHAT
jgi:two-component system NtrC family sensor kinase